MKTDKSIVWRRGNPSSLSMKGLNVAVVGGTGGLGRALSRFMASRGANVWVVGQTFRDADVPLMDASHRSAFLAASEALVGRARVHLPSDDRMR